MVLDAQKLNGQMKAFSLVMPIPGIHKDNMALHPLILGLADSLQEGGVLYQTGARFDLEMIQQEKLGVP